MKSSSRPKMAQIAISKSLCKEYSTTACGRTVYLNDGQEFQIQLYNPETIPVAAKIYINGRAIHNKVVIRPGERVWLDRYLDIAKKFKFETYDVDGSKETAAAISKNGNIEVEFFHEVLRKPAYAGIHDEFVRTVSASPYVDCCQSISNRPRVSALYDAVTSTSGIELPSNKCLLYCSSFDTNKYDASDTEALYASMKTGRVSEGSHSDQEFGTSDKPFNSFPFHSETIKLLPSEMREYHASDLQKVYCAECGRKVKPSYKYCPYCGSKVE